MPAPHSPSIGPALERALADVFNHQYQSHREGVAWPIVMRSVARAIAETIHPDSAELRASFLDSANLSGLFIDREPCCAHCSSLESAARQTLAATIFSAAGLKPEDVHLQVAEYTPVRARAEVISAEGGADTTESMARALMESRDGLVKRTARELILSVLPGANVREVSDGLQVGGFSHRPAHAQRMLREAGLNVRDHYGATIVSE